MSNKMLYRGTLAVLAAFIVGRVIYGGASDSDGFDVKACFEWITSYILPWIIAVQLYFILVRMKK